MCFSTEAMLGLAVFIFRSMVSPVAAVEPQPPVPYVAPKDDVAPLAMPIARLEGCAGKVACFNADGSLLLTAGLHEARLWDVKTFKPIGAPVKFEPEIFSSQFVADGKTVFTVADTETRLWDAGTGRTIAKFPESEGLLATISSDGSRVALTKDSADGIFPMNATVRVIDTRTGHTIVSRRHEISLDYVALSPDGSMLLTVEQVEPHTRTFRLWDIAKSKERLPAVTTNYDSSGAPGTGIIPAAFSADGRRVAFAGAMGFVVFDFVNGKKLADTIPPDDPAMASALCSIEFSADGNDIFAFRVGDVRRFDSVRGIRLAGGADFDTFVFLCALRADGKMLLGRYATVEDGRIAKRGTAIWDLTTGKRVKEVMAGQNGAMAFSPDGHLAVTAEAVREGESCTLVWEVGRAK